MTKKEISMHKTQESPCRKCEGQNQLPDCIKNCIRIADFQAKLSNRVAFRAKPYNVDGGSALADFI